MGGRERGMADAGFDPRAPVSASERLRSITWDEVREHAVEGDAWIVVHGRVYDVSRYGDLHPGGADVVAECAGEDATRDWEGVGHGYGHGRVRMAGFVSNSMRRMLKGQVVGVAPAPLRARRRWRPPEPPGLSIAATVTLFALILCCAIAGGYVVRYWAAMLGVSGWALYAGAAASAAGAWHIGALFLTAPQ